MEVCNLDMIINVLYLYRETEVFYGTLMHKYVIFIHVFEEMCLKQTFKVVLNLTLQSM